MFITCLTLSGCTSRLVDFTIISTRNIDFSKAATFQRGKSRVDGVDMAHWIIIIPTKSVNIKEAIDQAIQTTPGCVALLDGVLYYKFWLIPYIYGQQAYIIEGTPLIDQSLANNQNENPTYKKYTFDINGKIKTMEDLTYMNYSVMKSKIIKNSESLKFKRSDNL